MTGEIDEQRGDAFYNEHYHDGGWKYSYRREYRWHRQHIVERFGLSRGMHMLEVACGNGFHTDLFNRMGFDCLGVDRSAAGIAWAQSHYPKRTFHRCDFREMPFEDGTFDVVLARGFSYYHYDLGGSEAVEATTALLRHVNHSGVFIMAIATDLSGKRKPGQIWQNTLDDYRQHFASFGREYSVDWADGMAICGLYTRPVASAGESLAIVERVPPVAAHAEASVGE